MELSAWFSFGLRSLWDTWWCLHLYRTNDEKTLDDVMGDEWWQIETTNDRGLRIKCAQWAVSGTNRYANYWLSGSTSSKSWDYAGWMLNLRLTAARALRASCYFVQDNFTEKCAWNDSLFNTGTSREKTFTPVRYNCSYRWINRLIRIYRRSKQYNVRRSFHHILADNIQEQKES